MTITTLRSTASTSRSAEVHLGVDLSATGAVSHGWRLPVTDPRRQIDVQRLAEYVQIAQRGTLDFILFDESFTLQSVRPGDSRGRLDPVRIAARLAQTTEGLGLVAAVSEKHTDPVHIAKAVATVDRLSAGRAAWQTATPQLGAPASIAGDAEGLSLAVQSVARVWGTQDVPAPVVVVRADTTQRQEAAGRRADVVRISAKDAGQAAVIRERVRASAASADRDPDDVKVLVDIYTIIGAERASALARRDLLHDLAEEAVPTSRTVGHVGTAEEFVQLTREWVLGGATDGFTVLPGSLPTDLAALVDRVVPELHAAGLFRAEYTGGGLRAELGLAPRHELAAAVGH